MKSTLNPITKSFYSNVTVFGTDGTFMFKTSTKRRDWYIKNNLAVMSEDGNITLTFTPNGSGHLDDIEYFREVRKNECVCCGSGTNLTRHHVVPRIIRAHLRTCPTHDSFDVLMVCIDCHEKLEKAYSAKKRQLIKECGYKSEPSVKVSDQDIINKLLSGFKHNHENMPQYAKVEILEKLHSLTSGKITGFTDILNAEIVPVDNPPSTYNPIPAIMAYINDERAFIVMWRKLFLDTLSPKFLSPNWIDNHETYFKDDQ